jgi:hypothetical protein
MGALQKHFSFAINRIGACDNTGLFYSQYKNFVANDCVSLKISYFLT